MGLIQGRKSFVTNQDKMNNRKLYEIEPGLVRVDYSFNGYPQEELVLKLTRSLADCVSLPNDILCYGDFLRSGMKFSFPQAGLKIIGPFSGSEIRDEYIEKVKGRVVSMDSSFFDNAFNPLLVGCNSPYFGDTINEMKRCLSNEGFNIDASLWDDYKVWEKEKLATFLK